VLKWLRSKGCPWNEQTALDAAREGHLDVFEWALGNGAPDGVWGDEDENDPVEEWYVGGTAEKPPVNREEDEDEESLGDGMETQTSPAATPLKPKHNNTPTPKFTTPWSGGSAKKLPVLSPVKMYKRRTPVGTPGSAKRKTIGGCDEETPCKNQKKRPKKRRRRRRRSRKDPRGVRNATGGTGGAPRWRCRGTSCARNTGAAEGRR
jgi:hypothetical protein